MYFPPHMEALALKEVHMDKLAAFGIWISRMHWIERITLTLVDNISFQVGWVKADTKAIQAIHDHVITHNPRVSVSHNDHTTWNLHIRNVQEEDRGQYMCQINTDPMKSQVGYLDVAVPPDFISEDTSGDIMVPEGGTVRLTCRARGHPEPHVQWRREDGNDITIKEPTGQKVAGKCLIYKYV
nr:unnamed protein product [Callosobruchus analis]